MNPLQLATNAAEALAAGLAKITDAQLVAAAGDREARSTLAYQLQAIDKHAGEFPIIEPILRTQRERIERALRATAAGVLA